MVILSVRHLFSKSEIEFKLPENKKKFISTKLKKVLSGEEQVLIIDTDNGGTEFIIPKEVLTNSIINLKEVKEQSKKKIKSDSKIVSIEEFLKPEDSEVKTNN